MPKIQKVHAREILDSRGLPTVEVELTLENKIVARSAVPSGASTGAHEAHELRDGDKKRYHGKGTRIAVENVIKTLGPAVVGLDVSDQKKIDDILIATDGTANKSKLGANAILGISLASAKAHALDKNQWLFESLNPASFKLPVPLMNVMNGGAHANNGLDCQEFMIAPVSSKTFADALRMGSEIFQSLKKIISEKGLSTAVGDEGGFAPKLKNNQEALELIMTAIEKTGYRAGEDVFLALDVAATEFFADGHYNWEGAKISPEALGEIYAGWSKKFPIRSIEDGFSEDDWSGWKSFTKLHGSSLQLVGDDLFVTNPARLSRGIEEKAANSILIKVNQIGTLTETRRAVEMALKANFHAVMSHRSGETEDTTIADLAVGLGCQQIKTGSLCRSERIAKYNQLLRIEEHLGSKAQYWGQKAFAF
jgi:enolase